MIRLGVFQMKALAGDISVNLEKIEKAAIKASREGADLLVTPELSLPGYGAGDAFSDLSLDMTSPEISDLQKISSDHNIALVAGFAEKAGEKIYNSAAFIDGTKDPICYRKSHLYGSYEKFHFSAEKPETVLINFKGCKLGFLICYDVEFPENVRRLALAGAEMVLVPTALPKDQYAPMVARTVVPCRAFENQIFVAYANHCGSDGIFDYQGQSVIVAPDGEILSSAEDQEAVLVADCNPARYGQSRSANSYLEDL
ncbi:MAG: carbon-nitrogen hydrolase family protein [Sneathiellales bacterium]|nr:carbon-nitrogen hydrolase family protein [Sneathiellales bacterium]